MKLVRKKTNIHQLFTFFKCIGNSCHVKFFRTHSLHSFSMSLFNFPFGVLCIFSLSPVVFVYPKSHNSIIICYFQFTCDFEPNFIEIYSSELRPIMRKSTLPPKKNEDQMHTHELLSHTRLMANCQNE